MMCSSWLDTGLHPSTDADTLCRSWFRLLHQPHTGWADIIIVASGVMEV
jgi:hypothetical protein